MSRESLNQPIYHTFSESVNWPLARDPRDNLLGRANAADSAYRLLVTASWKIFEQQT